MAGGVALGYSAEPTGMAAELASWKATLAGTISERADYLVLAALAEWQKRDGLRGHQKAVVEDAGGPGRDCRLRLGRHLLVLPATRALAFDPGPALLAISAAWTCRSSRGPWRRPPSGPARRRERDAACTLSPASGAFPRRPAQLSGLG